MEHLICTWALTYSKIVLTFAIWSWFCMTHARAMSGTSSYCMSLSLSGALFLFLQISGYLNLLANTIDNFTHGLAVAASFLVSRKVRFLSPAVYWSGDVCSQVWCNMQKKKKKTTPKIRGVCSYFLEVSDKMESILKRNQRVRTELQDSSNLTPQFAPAPGILGRVSSSALLVRTLTWRKGPWCNPASLVLRSRGLLLNQLLSSAVGWVFNHNGHSPARNPTWGERALYLVGGFKGALLCEWEELSLVMDFCPFQSSLGDWKCGKLKTELKYLFC